MSDLVTFQKTWEEYEQSEQEKDQETMIDDDEEKYRLTIWGCLAVVMMNYNIDFSHMTPKMGEHMAEDLMKVLEKAGYIEEIDD